MKQIILGLVFLSATTFATEITLNPGSTATITASETTTVTCSGEAQGGSDRCMCKIVHDYSSYYYVKVMLGGLEVYNNRTYGRSNADMIKECKQWIKNNADVCQ
jgi:hypothetical protein